MPTYLCIQRSQPGNAEPKDAPSPAQMEEMYAHFNNRMEKFKDNLGPMGRHGGGGKVVTREGARVGARLETLVKGWVGPRFRIHICDIRRTHR